MDNVILKPGKDFIGIGVFALITDKDNKIILTKAIPSEKKGVDYKDIWSMPGGTVEFGETVEVCLKREILEELGIAIFDIRLLNYNDYITDNKHWIALNVSAKTNDEFRNLEPEKHEAISSFSFDAIPDNISPYTKKCLNIIASIL
ncbi:MAG: NUDIX domain-containing protein [Candidatus Buchananbacteria bacterium]|jgi:ADP-ribose pyrophosphatase YjhB (NUDIX family)